MNLNSLSLVVDFAHLPSEGFAALILAIIFTIVSLASVVFFFKHKDLNKIWLALIILALPALSIFCWIYLIISITDLGIGACFYISFACAAGYLLLMVALGFILNKTVKQKETVEETKTEEIVEDQETTDDNKEETEINETTETTENEEDEVEMFTVETKSNKE